MKSDDPTRNLGFLMHEVSRLLQHNFQRRVAVLGLTQAQWRTLAYLARNEGINQASLAEMIEVKPITLARLIDRLEEAGWVERRRDPADRRVSRLYLCEGAQPMLGELQRFGAETRKEALVGMTRSEQTQMVELLTRMKKNLLQVEVDSDATSSNKGSDDE